MEILGDEVMVEWFKAAREADPEVKLFLNDYAGLANEGLDTPHKDHFEKTTRFLIDQGRADRRHRPAMPLRLVGHAAGGRLEGTRPLGRARPRSADHRV
jgi:hypothetical protein